MNKAVREYVSRFQKLGLVGGAATESQIAELELSVGSLPASYKAYLFLAGQEEPSALIGSDCTIKHLPRLNKSANVLLAENGLPPLPHDAFVFLMHQGYQFFYFLREDNIEDPPVFYYIEDEPVVRRYERFTDLVAEWFTEKEDA